MAIRRSNSSASTCRRRRNSNASPSAQAKDPMVGRAKCPPHSFYSGKRPKDIASRETLPLPIMPPMDRSFSAICRLRRRATRSQPPSGPGDGGRRSLPSKCEHARPLSQIPGLCRRGCQKVLRPGGRSAGRAILQAAGGGMGFATAAARSAGAPAGWTILPRGNRVNRPARSIHFPPDGISRSWMKSGSTGQQVGSFARGNSLLYRLLSEEMCNAACEHTKV
jgi:hypothetical protein